MATTTTTSLEEIHTLHTIGLDLMEEGNFIESKDALSACLSELSRCITSSSPTLFPPNYTKDEGVDIAGLDASNMSTKNEDSASEIKVDIHSFNDHGQSLQTMFDEYDGFFPCSYFFECPGIREAHSSLPDYSNCLAEPPTAVEQRIMKICCLYNVGLCHHLAWHKCSRGRLNTRFLTAALSYYQQALGLARRSRNQGNMLLFGSGDSVMKILMAVCTNATCCLHELDSPWQAQEWNGTLLNILQYCDREELFQLNKGGDSDTDEDDDDDDDSSLDSDRSYAFVYWFFTTNAASNTIPRTLAKAA